MNHADKQAQLRSRLQAMGIPFDSCAVDKLIRYQEMLEDWNRHMNLTGDASFEALLDRHLMDSLTVLTIDGLLPQNTALIDVGSGAGLPGIPLAIMRPDVRITLLDSLQKRIRFLDAVIETLHLTNAAAIHARAEDAGQGAMYREQFDVAIARAVASLPVLLELLLPFVRVGGKSICYKGPSVVDELAAGKQAAALLGSGSRTVIPAHVPALPEMQHVLIVCPKTQNTPKQYPRNAGIPARKPLGS